MFGRRVLSVIQTTLIQLIAAWGLYTAGFEGYRLFIGPVRRDISFGLQLHHGMSVLLFLATMNAICRVICSGRRARLASAGCMVAWTLFWVNIFPSMPLRSGLVVGVGVIALALPALLRQA
ncbi:hypothetical protein ACFPTX_03915 [Pseudomonas sp. GCM10022188]|uniref:hypothetical protein n=1 Tax=Pseudomonas TaxID=286 RepID=UPI001E34F45B|nr:hypothetical protein [Pseudomonas oryzagri]MCC6076827.1 hypothetical protein [Pseudomonas oryzagri]